LKPKLKYTTPRMPFRWTVRESSAFTRISLLYRCASTDGIMNGLAAPLVLDLGCDRIQVFESAGEKSGGDALVSFCSEGNEIFRITVRREKQVVRIEVAAPQRMLVRSLPLCRRYFDRWFGAPPVCEEVSMLLAPRLAGGASS
jgi:hypothetical protein